MLARAWPACSHHCGCGRSACHGAVAGRSLTGETLRELRLNHLWWTGFTLLHEGLDRMTGKVVLTGEAVGSAEEDGINSKS
jgi:hypothetical protein